MVRQQERIFMKRQTKSPLREIEYRYAGQSLDEEIQKTRMDLILFTVMGALLLSYAIKEFLSWYLNSLPNVISVIFIVFLAIGYFIFLVIKVPRQSKRLRNMQLGLAGERAVGHLLEELRAQGCVVFHDIVGNQFNIDHVVISNKGILVIETKTLSKPKQGHAEIQFDGRSIKVMGREMERNPITQATAGARWLQKNLFESTGSKFPVTPVIVFPGWFVVTKVTNNKAWVINPKLLPAKLALEPEQISSEKLHMASFHLAKMIRIHT